MPAVPSITHLSGDLLVAIIAGLLFIEEAGVPVPFAPGDLLLIIGGIAIASGAVDPVVFVLAVIVATFAGALAGREIFALVGRPTVIKVANALRFRPAFDRATELLAKGGAWAVLAGRLIPGLRIHTTQVAGVTNMPRLTFALGLVPAVLVYVGIFTGLGALLGQPVVGLFHRAQHRMIALGLSALLAAAFVVSIRWLVRRGAFEAFQPVVEVVRRQFADDLENRFGWQGRTGERWREFPLIRRVWAWLADACLILVAAVFVVAAAAGPSRAEVVFDLPGLAILAAIALAYRVPLEAIWGQTIGKRMMGISVYGPQSRPPGWVRSLIRNLTVVLPLLWPVELWLLARQACRRRVGDLLATTSVRRVAY